jgi:hypothetical protein
MNFGRRRPHIRQRRPSLIFEFCFRLAKWSNRPKLKARQRPPRLEGSPVSFDIENHQVSNYLGDASRLDLALHLFLSEKSNLSNQTGCGLIMFRQTVRFLAA